MIPATTGRELHNNGVTDVGKFGISIENSAHIMSMLRDTVYTDKVMAVLREYSANAWDAHKSLGKDDVPIRVTLPTEKDSTLIIRDFGPGISKENIFAVYTQYGASSKRLSLKEVGTLGIGSKSGFAYADTFTVTSYNDGMKRIYVAVLDQTDEGRMNLLHEEPCGDETGIEIKIAILPDDIPEFETKALKLFKHFKPRPIINLEIPVNAQALEFNSGCIYPSEGDRYNNAGWQVLMGCIPYKIDLSQILDAKKSVNGYWHRLSGIVYFDVGSLPFSASREELKYNARTKSLVRQKLDDLVDEFVQKTLKDLTDSAGTLWDKRIRAQTIRYLELPLPAFTKDLLKTHIPIGKLPQSFTLTSTRNRKGVTSLSVIKDTRIVLRDDNRAVRGYATGYGDIVLYKAKKTSWSTIDRDLRLFIAYNGLTGLPVIKMSSLSWVPPVKGTNTKNTFNHKHKVFKFTGNGWGPKSKNWEHVPDYDPKPEDVYVVMKRFNVVTDNADNEFYRMNSSNESVAKHFGLTLPTIYGYRDTGATPVNKDTIIGTSYTDWQESFKRKIMIDSIELIRDMHWATLFHGNGYGIKISIDTLKNFIRKLGRDHLLTKGIVSHIVARRRWLKVDYYARRPIESMVSNVSKETLIKLSVDALSFTNKIAELYPLLSSTGTDLADIDKDSEWFNYVKMADLYNKEVRKVS